MRCASQRDHLSRSGYAGSGAAESVNLDCMEVDLTGGKLLSGPFACRCVACLRMCLVDPVGPQAQLSDGMLLTLLNHLLPSLVLCVEQGVTTGLRVWGCKQRSHEYAAPHLLDPLQIRCSGSARGTPPLSHACVCSHHWTGVCPLAELHTGAMIATQLSTATAGPV